MKYLQDTTAHHPNQSDSHLQLHLQFPENKNREHGQNKIRGGIDSYIE